MRVGEVALWWHGQGSDKPLALALPLTAVGKSRSQGHKSGRTYPAPCQLQHSGENSLYLAQTAQQADPVDRAQVRQSCGCDSRRFALSPPSHATEWQGSGKYDLPLPPLATCNRQENQPRGHEKEAGPASFQV